jgi:hypothetical protein
MRHYVKMPDQSMPIIVHALRIGKPRGRRAVFRILCRERLAAELVFVGRNERSAVPAMPDLATLKRRNGIPGISCCQLIHSSNMLSAPDNVSCPFNIPWFGTVVIE